jgi:predicted ATPase
VDAPIRISLTGGPGGGKSTLMRELHAADPQYRRWVLVPEAATLVISSGVPRKGRPFQEAIIRIQLALEDALGLGAPPGRAIVCDRGVLDSLAYWRRNGWDEETFHVLTGMTREQHLARYFGVIHLQTTAIGAEAYYRRWPDDIRHEKMEEAAQIDALCAEVWKGHPRYVLLDNINRDWKAKSSAAHEVLDQWLKDLDA